MKLDTIAACVPGVHTDLGNAILFWARPGRQGHRALCSPGFLRRSMEDMLSIARPSQVLGAGTARRGQEGGKQLPSDWIATGYADDAQLRGSCSAAKPPHLAPAQKRGRSW